MEPRRDGVTRPLRCAVYARVSSDKQDVENSLARQLRACSEWARANGHVVISELVFIDEARSGASTLARPAFQRLLESLRGRGPLPFDAVLIDDDSRLDRGGKMAQIVEAFQVRRVRLISVDNGRDLTNESERLLVHVKSGLNEHYLHELARRTRNGLASKVLHGHHAGGKVFGYRLVPEWPADLPLEKRDRENRIATRIEIDPEQAKVVLRVFGEYVAGAGQRAIAQRLNAEGVPSSRGKPSWDPSAIRVILLNTKYIGDWSWNRRKFQKAPEALLTEAERDRARQTGKHPRRSTLRPVEDLVRYRAEQLRIVPQDLWDAVQAKFAERARSPSKGRDVRRTRSVIASLLRCSCGSGMATTSTMRKGHSYTRVGCAWHRNRGLTVCTNSTTMRIEAVEQPLMEFLRSDLLTDARAEQALELYNRKANDRNQRSEARAKAAGRRAELRRLDEEISNLVAALARGTAYDAISAALGDREKRRKAVAAEVDALTHAQSVALPVLSKADVTARLNEIHQDLKKLDSDRAKLALERIFGGITVLPLNGAWENGWTLEMKTRPWAVLPSTVASTSGCGGRI